MKEKQTMGMSTMTATTRKTITHAAYPSLEYFHVSKAEWSITAGTCLLEVVCDSDLMVIKDKFDCTMTYLREEVVSLCDLI